MFTLLVIFHTLVCILLVVVVLMQSSKGEGLAGAFGGSGGLTGAVFGGRGVASFLSKATTILAIVFMINCGALAYMSGHKAGRQMGATNSVVTEEAAKELEKQQQQQQQQTTPPGGNQGQTPTGGETPTTPQQPAGGGK